MKRIFAIIFSLMIIFAPAVAIRAAGLVPDCGIINEATGKMDQPCDFNFLMQMINKIIRFILFYLATPLAALCFAYAGFLYLTSAGSTDKVGTAKKIIKNVLIGYLIALAAWLIVKTILVSLGFVDAGVFLNIKG